MTIKGMTQDVNRDSAAIWRPASEAEATSNVAAFVEWLRATRRKPRADPDDIRRWRRSEPNAFLSAVGDFCAVAAGDAALLTALAELLLDAETRPDDALVWGGKAIDPWPRAARVLGASVVFRPDDAAPDAPGTPPRSSP